MDGGTTTTGRATRLLAVLAVLFGLLAMHGLASAHHAAASPTGRDATGAAAAPAHADQLQPHRHAGTLTPEPGPAAAQDAALAAAIGPSCDADCLDLAMLCVAVLTGAVLAVLLARGRHPCLLLAPARRRARGPAPPARHARGPDPVRELCVSRT